MKIDNETQGQKEPGGHTASCLPAMQRTGGGWKEPGDTGKSRGHGGLAKEELGIFALGCTGIHKSIEKAAFNS